METQTRSPDRIARLRAGLGTLRPTAAGAPIARILMIVGGLLAVLGLLAIILGWLGASRTPYVFEQVPYLISGGLLGAAMAILGGLFYFGYWMTRSLDESRAQAARAEQALQRIEDLLAAGAGSARNGSAAASANGKPFVKTARGSMFHRPDCATVVGRDDLTRVSSSGDGATPCKICDPLAAI